MPQSNIDSTVCYQPVEGGAICGRPAIGMDPQTKRPCCAQHAPNNVVRPASRPQPAKAPQPTAASRPVQGQGEGTKVHPCIALNDQGRMCGATAVTYDPERGGAVCAAHSPHQRSGARPNGKLALAAQLPARREEKAAVPPAVRPEAATIPVRYIRIPKELFHAKASRDGSWNVILSALVYDLAIREARLNISDATVRVLDVDRYIIEARVTASWWAPDESGRLGEVMQSYMAVGDLEAEKQEAIANWKDEVWEDCEDGKRRPRIKDSAAHYAREVKVTGAGGSPVTKIVFDLPTPILAQIEANFATKRRHYPTIVATRARRNLVKKIMAIPQIFVVPKAEAIQGWQDDFRVPVYQPMSAPAAAPAALPAGVVPYEEETPAEAAPVDEAEDAATQAEKPHEVGGATPLFDEERPE